MRLKNTKESAHNDPWFRYFIQAKPPIEKRGVVVVARTKAAAFAKFEEKFSTWSQPRLANYTVRNLGMTYARAIANRKGVI